MKYVGDSKTLKNRQFKILFVCLGNICRSPTAEGVFRHLVAREAPQLLIEVDSAGTGDYHDGSPPDARSQAAARRRGIDIGGLRARQLSTADYMQFDWILAMDRDNLRHIEAMRPRTSRSTIGLFMDFAPQCGTAEVPDPYFGDAAVFDQVLDLITAASRGLIESLQQGAQQPVERARQDN